MDLREQLVAALIKAHIPSPRLEANIILEHAAPQYPKFDKTQKQKALSILERRINHEPMDKILGRREFYKYEFKVNSDVLSPRPETEILVEQALMLIPKQQSVRILDLGTGSGCILLTLLKERSFAEGIGVDVSEKALDVASQNACNLNVADRVMFYNKSWREMDVADGSFDIIVSNPPYIETEEIAKLEPEVRGYDPIMALDGGTDGLVCYREIAELAPLILKKGGYILLEVGYNQAETVENIFSQKGLIPVVTVPDLAGINRCVILKK